MGNDEAVRRVIAEFKSSPYYDPESYSFSGGQGREVPLQLTRPQAVGSDSISVTAMSVAQRQSLYAPGKAFPDFSLIDRSGAMRALSDYQGNVLLVDVWMRQWTPWKRDLPNLASTYSRYHAKGLNILGICMDRETGDFDAFLQQNNMPWPQVVDDLSLTKKLGLFGEASNYLIDRNGAIIGRDLHGGDLVDAIRRACTSP
jgi:peroxiredoxin